MNLNEIIMSRNDTCEILIYIFERPQWLQKWMDMLFRDIYKTSYTPRKLCL